MRCTHQFILRLVIVGFVLHRAAAADYDLVVYGGTSAGVIAAVQMKRMGKSVIIVCPDKHLGGLRVADWATRNRQQSRRRDGARFLSPRLAAYRLRNWQRREEFGNKGQGTVAMDGALRTMWIFEPHVAERVLDLIKEYQNSRAA